MCLKIRQSMGDLPKATGRSIDVAGICLKSRRSMAESVEKCSKRCLVRHRSYRSLPDTRRGMHQEPSLVCVYGIGSHGAPKARREVRFKRKGLNNRASLFSVRIVFWAFSLYIDNGSIESPQIAPIFSHHRCVAVLQVLYLRVKQFRHN